MLHKVFNHADSSCVDWVFSGVCLFVCLFFHTISQKLMQLSTTKLDTEMFNYESWKRIILGSKLIINIVEA